MPYTSLDGMWTTEKERTVKNTNIMDGEKQQHIAQVTNHSTNQSAVAITHERPAQKPDKMHSI